VEAVHRSFTTAPVIGGSFFSVGRELDMTVRGVVSPQPDRASVALQS
jgi:hypothetical protein